MAELWVEMHKAFKPNRVKGRIGHAYKDESLMKHRRTFISVKIRLYRKRFKVISDAGLDSAFNGKNEQENIDNNNKIDAVINTAGLGDISEDRWEKLQ